MFTFLVSVFYILYTEQLTFIYKYMLKQKHVYCQFKYQNSWQ